MILKRFITKQRERAEEVRLVSTWTPHWKSLFCACCCSDWDPQLCRLWIQALCYVVGENPFTDWKLFREANVDKEEEPAGRGLKRRGADEHQTLTEHTASSVPPPGSAVWGRWRTLCGPAQQPSLGQVLHRPMSGRSKAGLWPGL